MLILYASRVAHTGFIKLFCSILGDEAKSRSVTVPHEWVALVGLGGNPR